MENNYVDVHGLTLSNAKTVIIKQIRIAYENGISVIYINHGFNSGCKIKSWCLNEGTKLDYVIKVDSGENEGITKFYIKLNIKKI